MIASIHSPRRYLLSLALPLTFLTVASTSVTAQQGTPPDADGEEQCSASPDVLAEMAEMIQMEGEIELVSWLHGLSAEQASSATEASVDRLVFPKEGNTWLSCVEEGDIVWSILATDFDRQFALRVLEVTDEPDRVILRTRGEALPILMLGVRSPVAEEDPVVARIENQLPSELPGGLKRSFVESQGPAYSVSYSGAEGGLILGVLMADEEQLAERRAEMEEAAAEREDVAEETRDGRTLYLVDQAGEVSLTTFLDGLELKLALLPIGPEMEAEQLEVALDALDLDALEGMVAGP